MNIRGWVKEMMSVRVRIGEYELTHKRAGMLAGAMAGILIFEGSIFILEQPILSVFRIFYGFCILLPIAYYQMQQVK